MRPILAAGCAAVAVVAAADRAAAAVAVIPDVGQFTDYGTGDASVTYDGVIFSQSSAVAPNAVLFNVSPGFSGAPLPVLSSQGGGSDDILITLPYAVSYISFNYGTFDGSQVNFVLSNGANYGFAPEGDGYTLDTPFTVPSGMPFTSIEVTSGDRVLSIGDVTYGATVPEPETWALLVAGFGLTGAAVRRRVARAA